jgi:hypothetical protein
MFKDRTALAAYRLLEFPNETAQSWPIAKGARDGLTIRLLSIARDAGRAAKTKKTLA